MGGGESTLNSEVTAMINIAHQRGMETALVTNGSMLFDGFLRMALMDSRWVGISLDASSKEQYKRIHGVDMFDVVVDGIERLVAEKRKEHAGVEIAIKFLVLPENVNSIIDACLLAKSLGVDDFHTRPVDLERKDYKKGKANLNIDWLKEQFEWCHRKAEDDKFHVYTVTHKYDDEFHVKHDFGGCQVSPLVIQVCTDGNCYVCVDHRMEDRFKLGSMNNIKEWWGGDKHRELVKSIDPATECSRCTWSEYQRQFTEVIQNDRMCVAFP